MIPIKCKNCKNIFYTYNKKRKHCSPQCDVEYKNKHNLYKKQQQKRKDLIEKQLKNFKQISDKKIKYKNLNKKQKKKYHTLHHYIKKIKEKPSLCEKCNKNKPNILANLSGKYKKNKKDFLWVCRSCHNKMDDLFKNFKKAYLKMKRNEFGRFGDKKSLGIIKCIKCKKKIEKYHPSQKYCIKCSIKYNLGHNSKSKINKLKEKI